MTGLTIPDGGTNPGPAARAQPVEPDRTGEALAQFGQIATKVALQVRERQQAHAMERAEIDSARGLNQLRAEVAAIEDPFEAEQAWMDGVERLRADVQGRTRAPQQAFALSFDRLRDRHANSLGPQFLAGQEVQRSRNIDDMGADLAQTWAASPADTRPEIEEEFFDFLTRQVAEGRLSPEEADQRADAWLETAEDTARAAEDPEPEPEPEPDPAEALADRLDADPDLSRLAAARGYMPTTSAEVEEMAGIVARADEMEPRDRAEFLQAEIAEARRQRKAALPPPPYHGAGAVDAPSLAASARQLRAAWQAGRLTPREFARQADLLRAHQEVLDV